VTNANPWGLYQGHPSFVLGFHGTERETVEQLVTQDTEHLDKSVGKYEWLGHGIYFWENDPLRGLEWAEDGNAKAKIKEPDVVGAIIDLGLCLDLTTRTGLAEVTAAYEYLKNTYAAEGLALPTNHLGQDKVKRELDCEVVQALHLYRADQGQLPYDTIRAPFPEDDPLYDGAGFKRRNHIQIAVINPECIKGYFRPIQAKK